MQIFPKEIIENTVQAYIPKNGVKSRAVYAIVLTVVLLAICALPFLKVKIYKNAQGLVKPSKERIAITSLNTGKVVYSNIQSNTYVNMGDVLLVIQNNVLNEQIALTEYDTKRLSEEIGDLQYLLSERKIVSSSILGKATASLFKKGAFSFDFDVDFKNI